MQRLIEGVRQFQENVFPERREEFERLATGQSPRTLFITCSDSRIDPALLTQSSPGELFVIRNAGNIVPSYGAQSEGGEGPTIEYAIDALGVSDIVICGHSHCGAMKGLLHPEAVTEMPLVASWLRQAEATRRLVKARPQNTFRDAMQGTDDNELLAYTVERNVLVQMENLRTHPAVAAALAQNKVNLYGWVYHIESGRVDAYDPDTACFLPLTDTPSSTIPTQTQYPATAAFAHA